jgi:Z1 domain
MNHHDQVKALLSKQVGSPSEVSDISITAQEVSKHWVDPVSGGKERINGLIYGLVQSGKTGVLTATGALGADAGYRTLLILTSDIDPLYNQTLARAKEAFPGMDILGKNDIHDQTAFIQRIKSEICAIVVTKNASLLKTLIQNLKFGNVRGLSCLLIDDEADQASLNTKAKKDDGSTSSINKLIGEIRNYFDKNTYLQVTATPGALFLQQSSHDFRPKFTVLSHPGQEYVGGNDFFSEDSSLITKFPLADITTLSPGNQPSPALTIPTSLLGALDVFMIGATFKRTLDVTQNCAFLCHVSTKKIDHEHIASLMRRYRTELSAGLKSNKVSTINRLKKAYDSLLCTHEPLAKVPFLTLLETIRFLSPGIVVKLVNGDTDEDVAVLSPYNLFVGGNKLGRGVTIKNLLVSYYGRHPKKPQADTVLQHARMYGYRRKDLGLLRLYLPLELLVVFQAINQMETSLRELIAQKPTEEFRGVYLESGLNATRSSVIVPGSVGVYTGGNSYNPAQVIRDSSIIKTTSQIDTMLAKIADKSYEKLDVAVLLDLLALVRPDDSRSLKIWNSGIILEAASEYSKICNKDKCYIYVDRGRALKEDRRETRGILDGGESKRTPDNLITLFMLRTLPKGSENAAWWPQLRFPSGQYGFAFAV